MEITKQYVSNPKPFDLPSVQQMRSTFQEKLPLTQMRNLKDPAHDPDAQGQVHNVIETALDKYTRRCGFINKKLEMQHKINFMINELVDQQKKDQERTKKEKLKELKK